MLHSEQESKRTQKNSWHLFQVLVEGVVSVGRTLLKIFLNLERKEKNQTVLQLLILKNAKYLPPAIIFKELMVLSKFCKSCYFIFPRGANTNLAMYVFFCNSRGRRRRKKNCLREPGVLRVNVQEHGLQFPMAARLLLIVWTSHSSSHSCFLSYRYRSFLAVSLLALCLFLFEAISFVDPFLQVDCLSLLPMYQYPPCQLPVGILVFLSKVTCV